MFLLFGPSTLEGFVIVRMHADCLIQQDLKQSSRQLYTYVYGLGGFWKSMELSHYQLSNTVLVFKAKFSILQPQYPIAKYLSHRDDETLTAGKSSWC